MSLDQIKLKKLEQVLSLVDRDTPTADEIAQIIEALINIIKTIKSEVDVRVGGMEEKVERVIEIAGEITRARGETNELRGQVNELIRKFLVFRAQKGERGNDGKDADPQEIIDRLKSDADFLRSLKGEKGDTADVEALQDQVQLLIEEIEKLKQRPTGRVGGVMGIKQIVAGSGVSVDNSNIGYPVITASGSGGVTVETPPETPNGTTTVFTVTAEPKWVVADGITYYAGAGYIYAALTVTMTVAPSSTIRAII